jgi:PST family polysaccharide transporter
VSNLHQDKKALLSNFFSLSALQALNMVLPLLTLPYLVRVLGVENFGLINFVVAIIMYFNILVSFGFELSATREVSLHQDNPKKLSEIFFSVMIIKSFLVLFSFIILTILVLSVDTFSNHALLYYVTFGLVVGNLLFPSWFFQGMERMKYITYINVVVRVGFTLLIFAVVKTNDDYIYVPLFNTLGAFFGGIYSLWLVFKLFNIKIMLPDFKMIVKQVQESCHFFLSRVANNGSRYLATAMIGIYFGNTLVGYYSMVEKLFYAFMSLGGIVSQTIFPYMSRTKNIVFFKKLFVLIISVSIVVLIPVMYFNEELLFFVFHVKNEILSNMFIIVFSGSIFGIASALIGYPLLAAFGHIKYANNSLIYASIMYVMYIFIAAFIFKDIYLVTSSLIVYPLIGLLFRIYYIKKTNVLKKESI